jgi:hypothetical protein
MVIALGATATAGAVTPERTGSDGHVVSAQFAATGEVEPMGVNECKDTLEARRYVVTIPRALACVLVAAAPFPSPVAITACIGALFVTGVDVLTAGMACALGNADTRVATTA